MPPTIYAAHLSAGAAHCDTIGLWRPGLWQQWVLFETRGGHLASRCTWPMRPVAGHIACPGSRSCMVWAAKALPGAWRGLITMLGSAV